MPKAPTASQSRRALSPSGPSQAVAESSTSRRSTRLQKELTADEPIETLSPTNSPPPTRKRRSSKKKSTGKRASWKPKEKSPFTGHLDLNAPDIEYSPPPAGQLHAGLGVPATSQSLNDTLALLKAYHTSLKAQEARVDAEYARAEKLEGDAMELALMCMMTGAQTRRMAEYLKGYQRETRGWSYESMFGEGMGATYNFRNDDPSRSEEMDSRNELVDERLVAYLEKEGRPDEVREPQSWFGGRLSAMTSKAPRGFR